ncbi:MAG: hypothetical protein FWC72_06100, partial [Oscillospiraceae bacterium]|nr:hypothetical protein [Oscillospiraceae bacterium]
TRHACRRPSFLLSPKKEAKMRLWGFAPETPFYEGLAVLGGKAVRHRKAFLHVLLWVEPLFYCNGQGYCTIDLHELRIYFRRTSKIPAQPRTNIPDL